MKTIISLLFIFVAGSASMLKAQVSVIMEARVNIISGASLTLTQEPLIDFSSEVSNIGSLSLKAAPGIDINTRIRGEGDGALFTSLSVSDTADGKGNHTFVIRGKQADKQRLANPYKGAITTVIEYF